MERFPVLQPDDMTAMQRTVAEQIASGPRGGVRGPFIALLHNASLAQHVQALGEYLRFNTRFDAMLVEIAILVTARRWTCQYEWVAHAKLAAKAGVRPGLIDEIARGVTPSSMQPDEALVHAFCSGVNLRGEPDDGVFEKVRERFGLDGALDLIALCGYYALLAMVLNTAHLPLPDGAPPPLAPL